MKFKYLLTLLIALALGLAAPVISAKNQSSGKGHQQKSQEKHEKNFQKKHEKKTEKKHSNENSNKSSVKNRQRGLVHTGNKPHNWKGKKRACGKKCATPAHLDGKKALSKEIQIAPLPSVDSVKPPLPQPPKVTAPTPVATKVGVTVPVAVPKVKVSVPAPPTVKVSVPAPPKAIAPVPDLPKIGFPEAPKNNPPAPTSNSSTPVDALIDQAADAAKQKAREKQ